MKISIPKGNSRRGYRTVYQTFRGVDLSTDPALVDNTRSPDALNLISDSGGYPEKRLGWRTEVLSERGKVNGLFRLALAVGDVRLAHIGDAIYRWEAEALSLLRSGVADQRSTAFVCSGKLWILTGAEYLVFDGETLKDAAEDAYAPITSFANPPSGGGQTLEAANLLTNKRRNLFGGDGTTKTYQLDISPITEVLAVTVDGVAQSGWTFDAAKGTVTLKTAPSKPTITGEDNVEILFSTATEGYADVIRKCRFAASFGFGGDTGERIFFAGNPDKPNVDWHCEIHAPDYQVDPSYIPDTSFAYIGSDANAIMGYRRVGDKLAIIKAANDADATIFFRSVALDSNGEAVFALAQGVAGAGAISPWSVANLGDESLFLSANGIYGIASQAYTSQYCLQNRSYFVDARLTKENDLREAVAVEWDGRYLLAVNNKCYVLDGKQNKSYKPQAQGDYVYECAYWENIPARCWLEVDGDLWFGTNDGRICRFRTDEEGMSRFSDDDMPIAAKWSTKADDDGDFALLKSIPLRGSAVMVKPYTQSSAKITVRTERDSGVEIRTTQTGRFDFSKLSFENFTFSTSDAPETVMLNRKVKR
ncbi:MAG: hypothetical protein IKU55_00165, partial [Clostridia bacterium]|nr:hypothetical protein [Clostridia bacterium]